MKQLINFFTQQIRAKSIVYSVISVLFIFVIFHTIVWFGFNKELFTTKRITLAQLSTQLDSFYKRDEVITLPKLHSEIKDWKGEEADILTIGDSFSNGGGGGKNSYFQDYITSIYNKKVLNIAPNSFTRSYIETILSLNDNGLLDKINPKFILIELTQRQCVDRFSVPINKKYKRSQAQSLEDFQHSVYAVDINNVENKVSMINMANYDFVINPIYYNFGNEALNKNKTIYKMSLKNSLFSVKADQTLLFIKDSVDNIYKSTKENIKALNNNFNTLAKILKKKNIQLIFMPAVDKYDLYTPYIVNNTLPTSTFFEELRPLKKDYIFIDTKEILRSLLPKNKDVFYADDAHWSYLGSEAIVKKLPFDKIK